MRIPLSSLTAIIFSTFGLTGYVDAQSTFYYSYRTGEGGGGVAELVLDSGSGRLISQRSLFEDRGYREPHKVAVSDCGRYVGATADRTGRNNLVVIDLEVGVGRMHSLPRQTDAIEPWRNGFVIGANEGVHYFWNAATGERHSYNARQHTYPQVRKAEYIEVQGDLAYITVQKDSRTQSTKGSRVLVFDLANWRLLADCMMPRSRPDFELNSLRERGPSPEIVVASQRSNTLLLSMDRYGGVALADLDAVQRGEWVNLTYHSTAIDGSWGNAFPDRWRAFPYRGRDYVVITNAGEAGGLALVDLERREVVQRVPTPPGLENPVWLPGSGLLAATAPGKLKWVAGGELNERREPERALYVFRVEGEAKGGVRLRPMRHELPVALHRAFAVNSGRNDLVVAPSIRAEGEGELLVVSAGNGRVVERITALGTVRRMTGGR